MAFISIVPELIASQYPFSFCLNFEALFSSRLIDPRIFTKPSFKIENNIFRQNKKYEYTDFLERNIPFIGGLNFNDEIYEFNFDIENLEVELIATNLLEKLKL